MVDTGLGETVIETITFNIQKELKKQFQIKLIQENCSMTEKLNDFIKDYVKV